MLYPESIPGMETSEMRALRQREELVQSREAAKRRVAGEIEKARSALQHRLTSKT
jgi:hypothetical protein